VPAGSGGLQLCQLTVRAGTFTLGPLSLELARGRVLVVLGPSGAGKTLLLETIAGLRRPQSGRMVLGARDLAGLPPEARRVGLIFQQYALFPHLSVLDNVRFGLRARGIRDRAPAQAMVRRLGIAHLAARRPGTLSGGEQQRVALARALVLEPALMLLDEPLSALDAPTRDELRQEVGRILQRFDVPAVYVTHDQSEALAIADEVAILMAGRLRQLGPVQTVFDHPADAEVARFLGMEVLEPVTVLAPDAVEIHGHRVRVAGCIQNGTSRYALVYRAEDVLLSTGAAADTDENMIAGVIRALESDGPLLRVHVAGAVPLTALVFRTGSLARRCAVGDRVRATLPAEKAQLVPIDPIEYRCSPDGR